MPDPTCDPPVEAVPDDLPAVAATLAAAFQDDPALTWVTPDPMRRRARLARLFRTIVGSDARIGRVIRTPGDEAAALWRPPGWGNTSVGEGIAEALPMLRTFGRDVLRAARVAASMEAQRPREDVWLLHYVGVRPDRQGRGLGGRLIREGLARAHADGVPCWLETATPENVPRYRHLGFEVVCEWEVPGGGPRFWGMRWSG